MTTTTSSNSPKTAVEPRKLLKVLLVIDHCNPEWSSVPLIGYRFFHEISKLAKVTLVTHERNRAALERLAESAEIVYIPESNFIKTYYSQVFKLVNRGKMNWPLMHVLGYPVFESFNRAAYQRCKARVLSGEFDIVHVLTPMEPRYPIKMLKACRKVPFLFGPVNGGVPFPPGFKDKARAEFAHLNFLRAIGRWLLPGYVQTYQKADRVLAGSTYTLNLIKKMFKLPADRVQLFYENGILDSFLIEHKNCRHNRSKLNLLFVGRLVPYKSADILLEAIARLDPAIKARLELTIVGDGSEKAALEAQVQQLGLEALVQFTGWVTQQEIIKYYQEADIFCFPSIREYGGGVVLEAMACGLPCIVANNGGIAEYVTDKTGFRIDPISRQYLTETLADKIQLLVENESLRQDMSNSAIERARDFTWQRKALAIVDQYYELVAARC
jgi:glycosyltransferase involved in cell wall biosynthesis